MVTLSDTLLSYSRQVLSDLIAQPSVSAEGQGLQGAAEILMLHLKALGLKVELHPTAGAPVVYAEGGNRGPTLLFYNHYDVQPADPLALWHTPPFELVELDGRWHGRGASDDKGEIVARMTALKMLLEQHGELPFRLKWVIEGEEEIGSTHLGDYIAQNRERLSCDGVLWESGGLDAKDRPTLYCGVKGILALELQVSTAGYDLHSSYGTVVQNPIYRLAAALASLRNDQGRVSIAGFYDQVRPLTPLEQQTLAAIPNESAELGREFGVEQFMGQPADFYHRLIAEPCINFNGFHSGYGGPGSKTVLPAQAFAKLDIRLVPDQDPAYILHCVKQHLLQHGFADIQVVQLEDGEHPARSNLEHPWVKAAQNGLREVYGQEPVLKPNMTGTGPMHPFSHHLHAAVVGFGIGYPGTRIHSPNENIRIADFHKGVLGIKRALEVFSSHS